MFIMMSYYVSQSVASVRWLTFHFFMSRNPQTWSWSLGLFISFWIWNVWNALIVLHLVFSTFIVSSPPHCVAFMKAFLHFFYSLLSLLDLCHPLSMFPNAYFSSFFDSSSEIIPLVNREITLMGIICLWVILTLFHQR